MLKLLLLSWILVVSQAYADDDLKNLSEQFSQIEKKLELGRFTQPELTQWNKQAVRATALADSCISEQESNLSRVEESLEGLGEKTEGESGDVTIKREEFTKQNEKINKRLAECTSIRLSGEKLSERISEISKDFLVEKYLARDLNVYTLARNYLSNPTTLLKHPQVFLWEKSGLQALDKTDLVSLLLLTGISLVAGILLKRWLRKKVNARGWQEDYTGNFLLALASTISMYLPRLMVFGAAAFSLYLSTRNLDTTPFITELGYALLIYVISIMLIRLFVSPVPPADLFLPLSPTVATPLAKRLRILVTLGLIGFLAFYTVFSQVIDENNLFLVRNIFSFIFVLNFIWVLWLLSTSRSLKSYRWLFISVMFIVGLTLVLEWWGYRNLAFELRRSTFGTFMILCGFFIASNSLNTLFDSIVNARYEWSRKLHDYIGIPVGSPIPGTVALRLVSTLMVWLIATYLILGIWDPSGNVIEQAKSYLIAGFSIGEYRFVPAKILWALLVFALLMAITSWIRSQMEGNWLQMSNMDKGAREATVTITGYVLFVIAIVIALTVAGFNFSNIAIIAGALSVGIGFGLQNIVNNFVSGLILLFERPIRRGDWVIVGTTEGYVMDIRIRSTRIRTFDHSDIIVPNSELISGQVTNWMLSSMRGRAIIKVGVAYGSDTEKVRDILGKVADEHDNVVKDGTSPNPLILFRGFGDSSLDFELRVHLFEVESRLSTMSDINFAIDKAFREEDIEIPFPQRDLHVRTVPHELAAKE